MRVFLAIATLVLALGCGTEPADSSDETTPEEPDTTPEEPTPPTREEALERFGVLEPAEVESPAIALLGRRLFHERALSRDSTVSCSGCHMLSHAGAEPRATSIGIRGRIGALNAPSVLNAAQLPIVGWTGRVDSARVLVAGHIEERLEMHAEWPALLERLEDADYDDAFEAVYEDDDVTQARVLDALMAYLDSLVAPAPFDRWLTNEDANALDDEAAEGLGAFIALGCAECHGGAHLGGATFERLGVEQDYFERRGGRVTAIDRGRFEITDEEDDTHHFRVAPLRNVARTAPYFHDGSERTLSGAVQTMALVQGGVQLEDAQIAGIVAFLETLTSEIPAAAFVPGAVGAPPVPREEADNPELP